MSEADDPVGLWRGLQQVMDVFSRVPEPTAEKQNLLLILVACNVLHRLHEWQTVDVQNAAVDDLAVRIKAGMAACALQDLDEGYHA